MAYKSNQLRDITDLHEIINQEISDIFYVPTSGMISDSNMFVINFGKDANYSLHTFTLLRVVYKNQIILTSTDEFFSVNYEPLTTEDISKQKMFEKTLLHKNIKRVKKLLSNLTVSHIGVSDLGDVTIDFDKDISIQIILDCLSNNHEYYRFIIFKENIVYHHVLKFENKTIVYEVEYSSDGLNEKKP